MCMRWLLLTLNVYSRHLPNALQLRIVYICCEFSTIICVHFGVTFGNGVNGIIKVNGGGEGGFIE